MKLPQEIINAIFGFIKSELDAQQFHRALYTDGQDTHENENKFLKLCESKRWENGAAFVAPLPYSVNYQDEVRRMSAVFPDYSETSLEDAQNDVWRLFDNVRYQWSMVKRSMSMMRHFRESEHQNSWVWKIEAKKRLEKAAQYLYALENLLAMDSPLEEFLEETEGTVVPQNYKMYRRTFDHEGVWYMLETDEEFYTSEDE